MTMMWVALGAAVLIGIHLIGSTLRFMSIVPRHGLLSFAGGIAVAYVFIHVLPNLAEGASLVEQELGDSPIADHVVWLVALGGMVLFYAIETASRNVREDESGSDRTQAHIYVLSIASYGTYNAVVAYLLHEQADQGAAAIAFFVVAMSLHFLVNDYALHEHHKERYERSGRWILIAAVAVGAVIGAMTQITPLVLELTTALIAGGVILNVMKEELPDEADRQFPAFVAGAGGYAVLLLLK
jgi:multisubunit Na+/H+ antiporter MnhB subunit